ncbi:precorrin-8X methylmutase [Vibrio sp. 10N.247.310.17]|uniref:precorrin-8X methylmutase n=1 Tax=Vibrio sp. 10N.247.310.17 TaxID=3229979 RepID=UPI003553F414
MTNDMRQMTKQGRQIESDSFSIIDEEIETLHGGHNFNQGEWNVVRRAIHTTGDFEYAKLYQFSDNAIESAITALKNGANLITDVSMIVTGLNQTRLNAYGNKAQCFISHPDVISTAKETGETRAIHSMRYARDNGLLDGSIIGVGNAPTALLELLRMIEAGETKPALIIGIPVGFVKADESKQALTEQNTVPYIASLGRKGGSPLVVSTIHALLAESVK